MQSPRLHVFLTGPPGIGKTTLIIKICDVLKQKDVNLSGFYTAELRPGGQRIGFDVVTLDGKRSPLARSTSSTKGPIVGKYTVNIQSFESTALPLLTDPLQKRICVIDEIGKMELFSDRFKRKVNEIFAESSNVTILGTIPVKKERGIPFVENIRERSDVKVFEISHQNRDSILDDIVSTILSNY